MTPVVVTVPSQRRGPPLSNGAKATGRPSIALTAARSVDAPRQVTTRNVDAAPAGRRSVTNRFDSTCRRAPAGAPVTPATVAVSRAAPWYTTADVALVSLA